MYSRILVALDHSDVDQVILDHVRRLALALGSTVVLYRVAHYHTRDSRSHELGEASEYLAELKGILTDQGIPCETAIGRGEPAHAICEDAARLRCELIAMGIHGHSALERLVMGSVAEDVKRHTTLPLLLLRGR